MKKFFKTRNKKSEREEILKKINNFPILKNLEDSLSKENDPVKQPIDPNLFATIKATLTEFIDELESRKNSLSFFSKRMSNVYKMERNEALYSLDDEINFARSFSDSLIMGMSTQSIIEIINGFEEMILKEISHSNGDILCKFLPCLGEVRNHIDEHFSNPLQLT